MVGNTTTTTTTKKFSANPFHLLTKIFDLHLPYLTTKLHLQIEFALWICTILLTCASSGVLYKHSFLSTYGDWVFLSWVGLWLGRHFLLRLVCTITFVGGTVTFVDRGAVWPRHTYEGSWRRRKSFKTWLYKREARDSVYHRVRWMLCLCSPYNILSMLVKLIQTCAMAGQYCDTSAAHGVASAAMIMASGGSSGHDDHHHVHHHHSSKGSTHHHHSGGLSFGPYPQSNVVHTAVILSLARSWGTLCALSFAIWSLLRGEGGGMRGAVGEVVVLVGGVIWSWTTYCLSWLGLSSSSQSTLRSSLGLDSSGSGSGGGGGKKHRKKHSVSGHNSSDSHQHSSQSNRNPSSATSDGDRSKDFVGKLSFRHFPNAIRSQALHVQQMRTSHAYIALEKIWEACPSSQLVVVMLTTIFLLYGWLIVLGGYSWLLGNGTNTNGVDYQTVESNIPNFAGSAKSNDQLNEPGGNQAHSHFWRNQSPFPAPATFDVQPPSWVSLMFLVISFGTATSLLLYGRVLLPIPEFVAGTNVLKAIRAETRILGGGASVGKSSKSLRDIPWAENYKSITTENRLRLYYKVAIVRILENALLCAVLPQTEIICRITEHCEAGPLLWGPSGVTGIAGRRFGKGTSFLTSSYDVLATDDIATRIIIVTTVLITAVLLVGQMSLMNRTYLAIMGYISGEWELVTEMSEDAEDDLSSQSRFRPKSLLYDIFGIGSKPIQPYSKRGSNTLMQWDPKRRYQKGDRIAYDDCVYEAVSNSPEGPPFDPFLRAAHDLFCDELGHPSSSNILPCLSMGCVVLASMLLSSILIWRNAGWNHQPLVLCFSASLVGGYALTHSTERSFNGMKKIADEIALQGKLGPY